MLIDLKLTLNNTAALAAGQEASGGIKFNKTRIKDFSEKSLFSTEFHVKRILPLVEVEGILFLTNQRFYFQPYHALYAKPVLSFKINNINEFFKRRFKLMDVGLEVTFCKTDKNTGKEVIQSLYLNF